MKRFLYLALCVMSISFVGCGQSTSSNALTNAEAVVDTGTDTESAAAAAELIDVSQLPAEVDVQTVAAVANQDDVFLLDVREQWEYDEGHIPGITLIPMGEIASRLSEIPQDKAVLISCRSGNRSGQVTTFLRDQGFTNVHNVQGGILAWQSAGLPVE